MDLELRLEVICAEIEFDARVFVACDGLLLVDYRICTGRVERVFEDALSLVVAISGTVEVDVKALVRVGDPYMLSV